MKTEILDGNLYRWLEHLFLIKKLDDCHVISVDFEDIHTDIVLLIKKGRAEGNNWIFTDKDIEKDEGGEYVLPSVDIAHFFDCDNHHKFIKFARAKGLKGDSGDVESSAWYPRFKSKKTAEKAIDLINKLFDDRYIK